MSTHIALSNPLLALPSKRDLLLFDQIAVLGLDQTLPDLAPIQREELICLAERGIVIRPSLRTIDNDKEYLKAEAEDAPATFTNFLIALTLRDAADDPARLSSHVSRSALRRLADAVTVPPHTDVERSVHQALRQLRNLLASDPSAEDIKSFASAAFTTGNIHLTRSSAHNMAVVTGARVTPLLPRNFNFLDTGRLTSVAQIVVRNLPTPGEDVELENILSFREDENARRCLRRLHGWMLNAARADTPAKDLEAELELLIDKYTEYMRIYEMKAELGVLETFFTIAADFVGNVAKLNLGDAVRALFSVRERRIGLLEAELNAPGREVAYIAKAQARFPAGA